MINAPQLRATQTHKKQGAWSQIAQTLLFVLAIGVTASSHAQTCDAVTSRFPGEPHVVEVDGHPFALWAKTPPSPKATILLVHGRTWSGRPDFDLTAPCEDLSLMNGLAAAGIASYAVDMRGYGGTPRDSTGWLTPNRAAADIAGVLQWLNARLSQGEKAHLFGWSYGATMAQLTLQQQPHLAASLSLFGYAVRRGYHKTPADLPEMAPAKANTYQNAVSDFIVPNSISDAAINAFAKAALAADPIRVDWRELEQWKALDARKVLLPTLLLQGEFDPLTRKRAHRKLFQRLPNANKQWMVIKGGDHAAFMERPRDEFIQALSEFVLKNGNHG